MNGSLPAAEACATGYITDRLSNFNLSSQIDSLTVWEEESQRSTGSQYIGHFGSRGSTRRSYLAQPQAASSVQTLGLGGRGGMPRSKRRATASNHSEMAPSAPEDMPRHPTKRARNTASGRRHTRADDASQQAFSQKRCVQWFREYTTVDEPELLTPEGMEKFCEDIGVEPENVAMLVLAYTMNARQMGFFTQTEWLAGLTSLQCDSITKLQNRMDVLRNMLNEATTFKAIYRYAYDFARDKDQRSMDMETARAMLQLLLGKNWPLFSQFAKFLDQSKYKVINKDQWCNILEFSRTISNDLSNYDLDGAWPVMLDEFVEWLKALQGEDSSQMDARIS